MRTELAIKECENEIKYFEERGASAKGYLDFYRNEWQKIGSEYREEDIVAIYKADKVGAESARKRYIELTGTEYGDRRRKQR
jgi:hypothetical protein